LFPETAVLEPAGNNAKDGVSLFAEYWSVLIVTRKGLTGAICSVYSYTVRY